MAYVPVPKDLTQVKTKLVFNLTKRQLIFFSLAAAVGVPLYFLLRKRIDSGIAAILMVTVMLPFFLAAMYEKDGLPFEKVMGNIIRQKFINPCPRPYKTENFYFQIGMLLKKEGMPNGNKKKTGRAKPRPVLLMNYSSLSKNSCSSSHSSKQSDAAFNSSSSSMYSISGSSPSS